MSSGSLPTRQDGHIVVRSVTISVAPNQRKAGAELQISVSYAKLPTAFVGGVSSGKFRLMGKAATFWLYGIVSIGAWLFAFFLVPETKGKTLEQIEAHWRAGKHPREL